MTSWLFGRLFNIGKWFIGIVTILFVIVPPLINALGGRLELSIWEQFSTNGPGWFALAMGATVVSNYLTVVVAQGVTRARFAIAAGLAVASLSLLLALFIWCGYLLEYGYFQLFQWQHALVGQHLFTDVWQGHLVVAEYAVRNTLFALVGMIIGYGYYRVGGMWGTALLPLTLAVPLAAGLTILGLPGLTAVLTFGGVTGMTPMGAVTVLPYLALLLLIARFLLTTLPIKTKVG